ncbi:hypothetical protein HHK36_029393 [Tetracentron sinense]|uniref:V-type proton ATPase subunit C n=1 Tax=Tetracentron sinense TaxID=13715 RepID=A0A834YBK3_TETSI|nr:hypothetical protein HHK36_029393 [Tetracentron sinense]
MFQFHSRNDHGEVLENGGFRSPPLLTSICDSAVRSLLICANCFYPKPRARRSSNDDEILGGYSSSSNLSFVSMEPFAGSDLQAFLRYSSLQGTLDSLLSLSDDLSKSNSFVEGVSQKIRRQIEELERVSGVQNGALTVDGVPVDSYLTRFVWDEAKYPTMSPLRETVDSIHVQVAKIEDDLKLDAIAISSCGCIALCLAIRDLSNLVKPEDICIRTSCNTPFGCSQVFPEGLDFICRTAMPDCKITDKLTKVPRSSKKLHEDNEYALYAVTLFGRVADNFKTSAREKGFQAIFYLNSSCLIRDFEYSPDAQESRNQELERLMQDQETLKSSLLQWCYTSYGENLWWLDLSSNPRMFLYLVVVVTTYQSCAKVILRTMLCLAIRDLSNLVKPEDIIASEHLVTLLSVVPKYSQKDWLSSYETLTSYVIRDFEYSPDAQESRNQELERLMQDQETLKSSLLQWCYTSYGEVFSSWMHFCAVRVFAESILRYGLPPSFLAAVLAPSVKSEKKVRSILEGLCDSSNSTYWKSEDEIGGMATLGGDADSHPYVSFTVNLI